MYAPNNGQQPSADILKLKDFGIVRTMLESPQTSPYMGILRTIDEITHISAGSYETEISTINKDK
jgi:hypothetical protein